MLPRTIELSALLGRLKSAAGDSSGTAGLWVDAHSQGIVDLHGFSIAMQEFFPEDFPVAGSKSLMGVSRSLCSVVASEWRYGFVHRKHLYALWGQPLNSIAGRHESMRFFFDFLKLSQTGNSQTQQFFVPALAPSAPLRLFNFLAYVLHILGLTVLHSRLFTSRAPLSLFNRVQTVISAVSGISGVFGWENGVCFEFEESVWGMIAPAHDDVDPSGSSPTGAKDLLVREYRLCLAEHTPRHSDGGGSDEHSSLLRLHRAIMSAFDDELAAFRGCWSVSPDEPEILPCPVEPWETIQQQLCAVLLAEASDRADPELPTLLGELRGMVEHRTHPALSGIIVKGTRIVDRAVA
jgi:hypothetical protein